VWLWQFLLTLYGYVKTYIYRICEDDYNLAQPDLTTKPQNTRFLIANLMFGSFAVFVLLSKMNFLNSPSGNTLLNARTSFEDAPICAPIRDLPFWAIFILAELASFIVLVGAWLSAWTTSCLQARLAGQTADPSAHKFRICAPMSGSVTSRTRRLHRVMAPALFLAMIVTAYLASNHVKRVQENCDDETARRFSYSLSLLDAIVCPYFIAVFIAIFAAYFLRTSITFNRAATRVSLTPMTRVPLATFLICLGFALLSYVAALAIVGPPDLLFVVKSLRYLNLQSVAKTLVGF